MHAEAEPAQMAADAGTPANPPAVAAAPPEQPAPSPQGQAQPSPPPKQVAAQGTLVVAAKPFATVLLTGENVRKSAEVMAPRSFKLAAGKYQLTFQHPKGSKTESVTIEPNSTVKITIESNGTVKSAFRVP
jgi:hypothetical protein